jgi:RluA family pseudouridine synthase
MKESLFSVVYEDERIIAVNKASGVSVTGERWEQDAPRLDRLIAASFAGQAGGHPPKLFTAHRIDKDTSGLVVFAKDGETHKQLSAAFRSRSVEKAYTAVVLGRPAWPDGKSGCDLPLVPDGSKKHLTIIDKYRGKPSFTAFALLLSAGNYSIVEARPATGRTHQIRVHLAALGHPVVCDRLYGKGGAGVYLSSFKRNWRGDAFEERPLLARLGLHAAKLTLPAYGKDGALSLEAPLPRDMAALVNQMMRNSSHPALPDGADGDPECAAFWSAAGRRFPPRPLS